jgi:hypothetical protein
MTPSSEVWTAIIILGFALIGASVALWLHARRQLSASEDRHLKHRDDDSDSAPASAGGRHALRDPNAALAGILSHVAPRAAPPGGQHRAD